MNREIKFRVWCPTSKHFSTQPWLSCDGLMLKWEHTGDIQTLTDIRFDNYIIQQYTGLKDKNGKEIYEGDIISCLEFAGNGMKDIHRTECIVIFNKGSWFYSVDGINPHQLLGYAMKVKILGNIFENPELLEA